MTKNLLPPDSNLGRPLYCTHALWAGILDLWQRAREDSAPWDDIVFDKLAHCIHLFWNILHKQGMVSFKSAYFSAPGIHGPGPALRKSGRFIRPLHAIKVIQHIQESFTKFGDPDIHLFTLTPKRKYAGKQRFEVSPGRERSYLQVHLSTTMGQAFRDKDIEYRNLIAEALSKLDREEIRSLGTHQTKMGTLDAIEYNVFVHLIRGVIGTFEQFTPITSLTEEAGQAKSTTFSLSSVKYVLNEIERKTTTNRQYYEAALSRLKDERRINGNEVLQLVLPELGDPGDIWDSPEVSEWREIGQNLSELSPYLSALKISSGTDETSNSESEKYEKSILKGEEAREKISLAFNVTLPYIVSLKGQDPQRLRLQHRLFDIFDGLPHKSGKYKESYRSFKKGFLSKQK